MKHTPVVLAAVSALFLNASAMGAPGGIESQSSVPGQGAFGALTVTAAGQAASSDALVMLLDQFRAMREELETLRGMVEEQRYELQRLQADSMNRYTDLDSRISALYQAESGSSVVPADSSVAPPMPSLPDSRSNSVDNGVNSTPLPNSGPGTNAAPPGQGSANPGSATGSSVTQSQAPTIQPQLMTEQQLYQVALDSLLQNEQYQKSIDEFDQYLALYPTGRFVTNAHYWKGQAYVNLSMLDRARESFEIIVAEYPNGPKADDAMYSLGSVYDRLGNPARARELLQEVIQRFPNTSAANLADIYLRSMN